MATSALCDVCLVFDELWDRTGCPYVPLLGTIGREKEVSTSAEHQASGLSLS